MKTTKTLTCLLIATVCTAGNLWAADQPTITGVDALAAKSAEYADKVVNLSGIVVRVSAARNMFTMVDTAEADCTVACARPTIVVELGPGLTTLPKTAEPVIAVGMVAAITPAIRMTVTELITGKEAVAARLQEISTQ